MKETIFETALDAHAASIHDSIKIVKSKSQLSKFAKIRNLSNHHNVNICKTITLNNQTVAVHEEKKPFKV